MLKKEDSIIKEVTVLTGEIVDDPVFDKEAGIAESIAKSIGRDSKIGQYLGSDLGKQLISRVGKGAAAGAAAGAMTSKDGERGQGAIKGALLGAAAGGGYHAFQSGGLKNVFGTSLESRAIDRPINPTIAGKAREALSLEHQIRYDSILNRSRDIDSNKLFNTLKDASQTARSGQNRVIKRFGNEDFMQGLRQIQPHLGDASGSTQRVIGEILENQNTTQFMSGWDRFRHIMRGGNATQWGRDLAANLNRETSLSLINPHLNSIAESQRSLLNTDIINLHNDVMAAQPPKTFKAKRIKKTAPTPAPTTAPVPNPTQAPVPPKSFTSVPLPTPPQPNAPSNGSNMSMTGSQVKFFNQVLNKQIKVNRYHVS